MVSSLSFIDTNGAVPAYDAGVQFEDQQQDRAEKRGVDAALRGGVSDMLAARTAQQSPLAGVTAAPAPAPTVNAPQPTDPQPAATVPTPPPTTPTTLPPATAGRSPLGAVDTSVVPPMNPAAPPGVPPTRPAAATATPAIADDAFGQAIRNVEGGSGTINKQGFAGTYQFGTAALAHAGAYHPSPGEDLTKNQWTGTINLPGRAPMSVQQFVNDEGAQDQAWGMHKATLSNEISARGLDRYIGQTIAGVPITQDTIAALMQQGGPTGTQKFLKSGGRYNPSDGNLTMAQYGAKVAGDMGLYGTEGAGQAANAPAVVNPTPGSVSGAPVASPVVVPPQPQPSRYDPLLARLAQQPGGGAMAVQLMGQQRQEDAATLNRQTAYQRMALQALGRGDNQVFQYYAQLGGLNLPPQVTQDAGTAKRLATASLTAERFYRNDPAGAQKFTQAYMQSGNVDQAFAAAGPPRDQPNLQLQWVRRGAQDIANTFNPRTGQMTPMQNDQGQPVTRDVGGAQTNARVTWVQNADGTKTPMQARPDGTMAPYTGDDGAPVSSAAPPPTSARVADRTVRLNMLRAAGVPEKDANLIAGGGTVSPNTIASTYARVLGARTKAALTSEDQAKVPAQVGADMDTMFGPGWRDTMHGQVGQPTGPTPTDTAPPAPTIGPGAGAAAGAAVGAAAGGAALPQADAPASPATSAGGTVIRPATVPPGSVWSPSKRMFRDPQGNLYDQQGRPVPAAAPQGY